MASNLAFLLEDEEIDRIVLENRLNEVGLIPVTYNNVEDAKNQFNKTGDIYVAYFLDMQVPVLKGETPVHKAGLELRDCLIGKNVNPNKIFLMSGVVSYQDEIVAKEYAFSSNKIIGKGQFTEQFLRELLEKQKIKF